MVVFVQGARDGGWKAKFRARLGSAMVGVCVVGVFGMEEEEEWLWVPGGRDWEGKEQGGGGGQGGDGGLLGGGRFCVGFGGDGGDDLKQERRERKGVAIPWNQSWDGGNDVGTVGTGIRIEDGMWSIEHS